MQCQKSEERAIPLAIAIDENYAWPTVVSITSILENKSEKTYIALNVLHSEDVTDDSKENLKKLVSSYKNCSIQFINMKDAFKDAYLPENFHFAKPASYYRLALPYVLLRYNKVLYTEADTITSTDLWELFSTNIEKHYIAGSACNFAAVDKRHALEFKREYKVENTDCYVPSGLLLMNLKRMRDDNLGKKFQELINDYPNKEFEKPLPDQDILNAACYKNIKVLSPKYHVTMGVMSQKDGVMLPYFKRYCTEEEWKGLLKDPAIIHWGCSCKPWNTPTICFAPRWYKYQDIAREKLNMSV